MSSAQSKPTGPGTGEPLEIGESFMVHAKKIQQSLLPDDKPASETLAAFLKDVQKAGDQERANLLSTIGDQRGLQLLLSYLSSPHADALAAAREQDLSQPMSQYYISSSHNTYLTGNQLYSDSSVDGYKSVLLHRCRCVEIDVWDGRPHEDGEEADQDEQHHGLREKLGFHRKKDAPEPKPKKELDPTQPPAPWKAPGSIVTEPRVLHGHTFTREVSFRKVCEAIRDTAFVNSDLPLIVSLEIHTSNEQQAIMVDIMKRTWGEFLLDASHRSDVATLPGPDKLRKKILIKVKYTPPEKKKQQQESGAVDSDSEAEDDNHPGDQDKQQKKPKKKKKIIDELSALGIYTQSCHFSSFDQPEAKLPTHVFAVSENRIIQAMQTHRHKLFAHNRRYFMRAYPKGLRVASTNLNPIPMWRQGVQLVALNWQKRDQACMINTAMFAGTGGWVLKPALYRNEAKSDESATEVSRTTTMDSDLSLTSTLTMDGIPRQSLDVNITVYAAQNLADSSKHSRPYVKCILHTNSVAAERDGGDSGSSTSRSRSPSPRRVEQRSSARKAASSLLSRHRDSSGGGSSAGSGAELSQARAKTKIKTRTGAGQGASPDLHGEVLKFSRIPVEDASLAFVRFKVMKATELRRDDLVGWACFRLERLRQGVRVVKLFNRDWSEDAGRLLVKVEWSFRENLSRSGALPVRSKAE